MSILKGVLEEEYQRLQYTKRQYSDLLSSLPKGSLSQKKRGNKVYIYRAFRIKDKVKFVYIGKADSEAAVEAYRQFKKRQQIQKQLKEVNNQIIALQRSLRVIK